MANIENLERHLAETSQGQAILNSPVYRAAAERAGEVGFLRRWIFSLRGLALGTLAAVGAVAVPAILHRYGYADNAYSRWASGAVDLTAQGGMNAATGTYNFLANPSTWLQRGQNAWNAVATPVADAGRSVRGAVVDAPYQRGLEIDASRTAANLQPASTLFAHSDPGANGMMSAINVALQQNRQR